MDEAIVKEILELIAVYVPSITGVTGIVIAVILCIKQIVKLVGDFKTIIHDLVATCKKEIEDLNATGELKEIRTELRQLIRDNATLRADNAALRSELRRIRQPGGESDE